MSDSGAHAEVTASPVAPIVRRTGRQRRPTGAPPPLPHRIAVTTAAWVALAAILVTGGFLVSERMFWRAALDRASTWMLQQLATVRTPWLTHVANGINVAGLYWHPVIGVLAVLLIMVFRRWRHLLVLVLCLFFLEIVVRWIYNGLTRPRPFGVPIIGAWDGYSAPSAPVAAVTFFLMGAVYCLVVPGRPRSYAKAGAAA